MLARLRVLLPEMLLVSPTLESIELRDDRYDAVVLHPPYKCLYEGCTAVWTPWSSPVPKPEHLSPEIPQRIGEHFKANGEAMIEANALAIDFRVRKLTRQPDGRVIKPSVDEMFETTNRVLEMLRAFIHAPQFKPLGTDLAPWRIECLNDDGTPDPKPNGGYQMRVVINQAPCTPSMWSAMAANPDYEMPAYLRLWYDSRDSIPAVGASVVLAYAAIETRIEQALDVLAVETTMPQGMWEYINSREPYWKEPSVADQLDVLLRCLTGQSLKDHERLWTTATKLKDARNSLVHTGAAVLGKKKKVPVTSAQAKELVDGALDVLDWIETMLAEHLHRPRRDPVQMTSSTPGWAGTPDRVETA